MKSNRKLALSSATLVDRHKGHALYSISYTFAEAGVVAAVGDQATDTQHRCHHFPFPGHGLFIWLHQTRKINEGGQVRPTGSDETGRENTWEKKLRSNAQQSEQHWPGDHVIMLVFTVFWGREVKHFQVLKKSLRNRKTGSIARVHIFGAKWIWIVVLLPL